MSIHLLKKYHIILLTLISLCISGFAEESEQDKVNKVLSEIPEIEEDSLLVDAYNELAFHYGTISLDSSSYYLAKAKDLAIESGYDKGLAQTYSFLARVNIQESKFEESITNFDSALFLFSELHDTLNLLDCYMGQAYVYTYQSRKLHSLECNQKALPLAIAMNDSVRLSLIYNNIASFYYRMDDFDKTFMYFKKSLEIEQEMSRESRDLVLTYSNIGMLLVKHGKYEEAKPYFDKLQELLPKVEGKYIGPVLHLSLASYFTAIEDVSSSKNHLDIADTLLQQTGYVQLRVRLYKRRADWFFLAKDYSSAIECLNESLRLQTEYEVFDEREEIYVKLAEAYYQIGDFKNAYNEMMHFKQVLKTSDSERINYFLLEFEEKQQEFELEQRRLNEFVRNQELEHIAEQLELRYYLAVLLIFVLISALIFGTISWRRYRQRGIILSQNNAIIEAQKQQLESHIELIKENEEKLRQANATKDKFLSIIAHDLRSPFSSLIGFSDLMVEKIEQNQYGEILNYSKLINQVSKDSYTLLNNLLEWATQQVGKMSFSPELLPVNAFLDEMLQYFNKLVPGRQIKVDSSLSSEQEMSFDNKMMHSVFRNLISNALKYTPEDGLITLKAERKADNILFAIEDTGIGMSQEQVDKLFKIDKAESTRGLKNEKGTGLGLILCKDFVEKHQGHIWVESIQDKGTIFYFEIPLS